MHYVNTKKAQCTSKAYDIQLELLPLISEFYIGYYNVQHFCALIVKRNECCLRVVGW